LQSPAKERRVKNDAERAEEVHPASDAEECRLVNEEAQAEKEGYDRGRQRQQE
jgi:hypothetical protein